MNGEDMAKEPAFQFYPGDYLRDTQCLSEKSQVAYDRIMCEHMRNTSIHVNNIALSKERVEFFIKRLNDQEKEDIYSILKKVENGFQIEWVADSISKSKAYSESRSKNRKKDMKTHDDHMEDEDEDENDHSSKLVSSNEYPSFEDFWNLYDKKIGRDKSESKWNKLSQKEKLAIMEFIPKYKESQPNKKYRQNPQTFFNNKTWKDEIIGSDNKGKRNTGNTGGGNDLIEGAMAIIKSRKLA